MESLSRCLSASPPFLNPFKTLKSIPKSHLFLTDFIPISNSLTSQIQTLNRHSNNTLIATLFSNHKPHFSLLFLGLSFPQLSCFAAEITTTLPTEEVSTRINLESILVSIDNFFNRYPFFVATVAFIWLVVIPLTEEYLQKYKFISALDAFKKLQDDPSSQLLDIRERKSIASLGSPNLKLLNKSTVQVEFREEDEEGFVTRVLEFFGEPSNTVVCILDK